jgi:hypothetical protein
MPLRTEADAARVANSDPNRFEPLYGIHPLTGVSIEVLYADRTLETFGWRGPGWFWWYRRRGCAPLGPRTGPFASSYAAYRNAVTDGRGLNRMMATGPSLQASQRTSLRN